MESSKRHLENLIDGYFAGQLSFEQTEELFALLKEDTDLFDQLLSGDMPSLVASTESFPHKSRLRRSYSDLSDDQFEHLCIASLEGDLSHEQEAELNAIIETDPARSELYNTYKRLRIEPATVIYKAKSSLKRRTPAGRVIRLTTITLSAAATLALFITAVTWFNNSSERDISPTIAATSSEVNSERVPTPAVREIQEVVTEKAQAIIEKPVIVRTSAPTLPVLAYNETVTNEPDRQVLERAAMPPPVSGGEAKVILTSATPSGKLADVLYNEVIPYHGPISLKEHLAMNFREKILGEEVPDISPIKAYEIASAGITGINKLLGWEMDFEVKKERSGEVNTLAFNSRLINFETPVKKAENEQ